MPMSGEPKKVTQVRHFTYIQACSINPSNSVNPCSKHFCEFCVRNKISESIRVNSWTFVFKKSLSNSFPFCVRKPFAWTSNPPHVAQFFKQPSTFRVNLITFDEFLVIFPPIYQSVILRFLFIRQEVVLFDISFHSLVVLLPSLFILACQSNS